MTAVRIQEQRGGQNGAAPQGEPSSSGGDGGDRVKVSAVVLQDRYGGFDRATLWVMAVGLALMLQPWWDGGLRVGFFVTLGGTVAQIVASHLRPSQPESGAPR